MRFYDPLQEFSELRREIERAFDTFRVGDSPRNAFLPGRSPRNYPFVNVWEDSDNVFIEALAPGLNPETLSISVLRNQLTITGEKPPIKDEVNAEAYHRNERATGKFVRSFSLPAEVNDANVQANYRAGILSVMLPKAETAKPKRISVNVA